MLDHDMHISEKSVLAFLWEGYSYVLEYSANLRRAYIQDEDSDDGVQYIPVVIVRNLIAKGEIAVWRDIGQWNRGYDTYKPTEWVKAWVQERERSKQ